MDVILSAETLNTNILAFKEFCAFLFLLLLTQCQQQFLLPFYPVSKVSSFSLQRKINGEMLRLDVMGFFRDAGNRCICFYPSQE